VGGYYHNRNIILKILFMVYAPKVTQLSRSKNGKQHIFFDDYQALQEENPSTRHEEKCRNRYMQRIYEIQHMNNSDSDTALVYETLALILTFRLSEALMPWTLHVSDDELASKIDSLQQMSHTNQ
jgi:hypothetical protein